jgi:hypothetical protein
MIGNLESPQLTPFEITESSSRATQSESPFGFRKESKEEERKKKKGRKEKKKKEKRKKKTLLYAKGTGEVFFTEVTL